MLLRADASQDMVGRINFSSKIDCLKIRFGAFKWLSLVQKIRHRIFGRWILSYFISILKLLHLIFEGLTFDELKVIR